LLYVVDKAPRTESDKTYKARDIARYFLAKTDPDVGELISNLKLQKLCYYAQGLALAARGRAIFDEPIEAWLHGPVVPFIYQMYKDYGKNAIAPVNDLDLSIYNPEDRMILDDVFDYYGQYSAWRLRQMTHEEAPWRNAYAENENQEISLESIAEYFADEVSDDYRVKYEKIEKGQEQAV